MDTELVEQLQEGCIWRQARGAATEVLGAEDVGESLEKVPTWQSIHIYIYIWGAVDN